MIRRVRAVTPWLFTVVLSGACAGNEPAPGDAGDDGDKGGTSGASGSAGANAGVSGASAGVPGTGGAGVAGSAGTNATGGSAGTSGSQGAGAGAGGTPSNGGDGGTQSSGGGAGFGANAGSGGGNVGGGGATGGAGASAGGGRGGNGGASAGSSNGGAGAGGTSGGRGGGGGMTGGRGGAAGGGNSDLLVPAQGALLGAFVGTGTFQQFETLLGRSIPIVHNFFGWTDNWTTRAQSDLQSGKIPLITWEPWNNSVGVPLDEIIGGTHDSMIQSRAQAARATGQKFFLRWGHEMNGNWYPWDGSHNGANASATAKYVSAYRHIHDIFKNAGATNVLWVFCPNVDSVPGDSWNAWSNYYPGDAYVDWMGLDGYNWGTVQTGSSFQSFSTIVGRIYPGLAAKGKPIMIPETASTEQGGDKAAWINGILPALQGSFPGIKAFSWFEMNKETDWRAESSTGARQAFITFANNAYMNP
ncbi:MAG TPA: glycosyl hydrolase [Polyangiaceae bacterium]